MRRSSPLPLPYQGLLSSETKRTRRGALLTPRLIHAGLGLQRTERCARLLCLMCIVFDFPQPEDGIGTYQSCVHPPSLPHLPEASRIRAKHRPVTCLSTFRRCRRLQPAPVFTTLTTALNDRNPEHPFPSTVSHSSQTVSMHSSQAVRNSHSPLALACPRLHWYCTFMSFWPREVRRQILLRIDPATKRSAAVRLRLRSSASSPKAAVVSVGTRAESSV
jgi:hypothetical protein